MRWITALAVLAFAGVHGQVGPTSVLLVVDLSHASGDDRDRVTRLAQLIAPEAETRVWSGLGKDPVAKYRLSFAEAFDIVRGNATVLQTVRSRECTDSNPSCGADLPMRARQSLDAFDDLARSTVSDLTAGVSDLARRDEPRPHTVVFLTTGLPYRSEPRREFDTLRNSLRGSAATLAIVDAGASVRASAGVSRMTALVGGIGYLANDDGIRKLQASLTASDRVPRTGGAGSSGAASPASAPRLSPEVDIASRHAVAFAQSAETLLADEHYVQEVKRRPSSTSMPLYSSAGITLEKRELDSEVALIQLKSGELWLLARDVQRVDNRPVDPAQRIPLPTVRAGTDAEALKQLRAIAAEGSRFNIGGIRRDLNIPTLALWLLTPAILPRFDFSVGGTETIDGRRAVAVRFKERQAPYLFSVDDVSVPTSGRFWLDRQNRAVIRTELVLQSAPGRLQAQAQIVVNYRFDANSEAWVPRDMAEQYNAALTPQFVIANATYSNIRRFSSTVRIVK
jgi:hypothetical protein